MSKQTNRKVFAATASAALVASAVVPAATFAADTDFTDISKLPADEQAAINALVEAGFINGKGDGKFDPYAQMKRAEAATVIAKVLDLDVDKAPSADFDDVADNYWAKKFIDAAVEAEILEGKGEGKFDPEAPMKRAELAQIVVKAFDLKLVEGKENNFNDVADNYWGKEAIEVLYSHGLITGKSETRFAPEERMQRNHVALLLNRTLEAVNAEANVTSVSAINQTSLQLNGTGLQNLKAEDITVENNTVKSVTANANGTSATVELNDELIIDEATKVTIGEKEFTVTYSIEAKKISVVEATYDDDTADQYLALNVDGKTLDAQELINAGYTVKYEAFPTKQANSTDRLTTLFENDETGKLKTDLDATATGSGTFLDEMGFDSGDELPTDGVDVYVKVTAVKGTEVISSDIAKIKIQNIDLAANAITKFVLLNFGADGNDDSGSYNDDFEHNSTTLVTGEKAKVSEITVKAGAEEEDIDEGYSLETSDKSVFTVDGNVITAQGPGTATLTVKYGGVKTTKTITVKNDKREVSKVSLANSNLKVGKGQVSDSKIYLFDQYGDPMADTVEVVVSNEDIIEIVTDGTGASKATYSSFAIGNNPDAETKIFVKGLKDGSTTVTFRDSAGVKIGTTTLRVQVSENTDLARYELKVDSNISSGDLSKINGTDSNIQAGINGNTAPSGLEADDVTESLDLDLQAEKYVKIDLKAFNASGFELDGLTAYDDYTVQVLPSRAGVIKDVYQADGFLVVEADELTGSATIVVTNNANSKVKQQIKVNVIEKGYNVNNVTFKAFANPTYSQTINYEDLITHTKVATGKDPVVSGLKLTKETSYPIRLDINNNKGDIYIDKNANGTYESGEVVVGSVQLTYTGSFSDTTFTALSDSDPKEAAVAGANVETGDDGTLLFKVVDNKGHVVATKAIEVDF